MQARCCSPHTLQLDCACAATLSPQKPISISGTIAKLLMKLIPPSSLCRDVVGSNAASRLNLHQPQSSSHALAYLTSVKAVGEDDLASVRQISSPLIHCIGRVMKSIGHKRIGTSTISVTPHVNDDRRRFGTKPCIKSVCGNRVPTVVHAECCAVLGPRSQGETAYSPVKLLIWHHLKCNSVSKGTTGRDGTPSAVLRPDASETPGCRTREEFARNFLRRLSSWALRAGRSRRRGGRTYSTA